MQYGFMNLSQAQEDMEKLKQAAGVVEQALDDGFGAGLREIVEKNQNISEDEAAGIMQMPYYRDRAACGTAALKRWRKQNSDKMAWRGTPAGPFSLIRGQASSCPGLSLEEVVTQPFLPIKR